MNSLMNLGRIWEATQLTFQDAQPFMQATMVVTFFIGLPIVLFFIIRYFWLWYWKINTRVELLEEINAKLTLMLEHMDSKKEPGKDS